MALPNTCRARRILDGRRFDVARRQGAPGMTGSKTVHGWRLWYVRPDGGDPLRLYSPSSTPGHLRYTTSVIAVATCPECPRPPGRDCECGMYAVSNVLDALYRLDCMTENIRTLDRESCWLPACVEEGMVPVLARVKLTRVRSFRLQTPASWSAVEELRAGRAEIKAMFVQGEVISVSRARKLARRLTHAYGVPAAVGYPEVTASDFDTMPQWLQGERAAKLSRF